MTDFEQLQKLVGPEVNNWSEAERQEANDNLRQYVALVLRVLERLELDPEANARFEALTECRRGHSMNDKEAQNNSSTHT
ncbi:MAG TPA: hypothetical protein VGQ49_13450 [Bryobacteraceae bacterium]|jgi:hypothetical protein|nr:hypothetical protein [Bryobacteraceae bacterium]